MLAHPSLLVGPPMFAVTWIVPLVGLLVAGVALGVGFFLMTRRTIPASPATNKPQPVPPPEPPVDERRTAPRHAAKVGEAVLWDESAGVAAAVGRVVDQSLGGVGLVLQNEVPVKSQLQLRVKHPDGRVLQATVEVRYCRRRDQSWRTGCQFVQSPSFELLDLLCGRGSSEPH